jgi:prolipoprotein diacylglyceryltransferase
MNIVESIRSFISSTGFLPVVILAFLICLYVYWVQAKRVGKNQNSIFDGFFISSFIMVIWGRISYLLSNPSNYEGLVWSLVPYEKYPDGFFIFRLLPWRFFRVWDGEFLFTGLFVAFILTSFIYCVLVKKWRWREMLATTLLSATVFLGTLFAIYGFVNGVDSLLWQGVILLFASVVYSTIYNVLKAVVEKKNGPLFEKLNYLFIFLYTCFVSIYLPFSILNSDITSWDSSNMYIFIAFSVISLIVYIIDVFRKNIVFQARYKVRSTSISTNQPIKL